MFNNFYLDIELRKSTQKTVLNITEEDLQENQDKVLNTLQKECIDLNSWFYIILYYYSKGDYMSFEKFARELAKLNISENPFYKGQEILFINIINIISLFYSFISDRSKDKQNFDTYSKLSIKLSNKADNLKVFHPPTIITTALFSFIKGDYEDSESNFKIISDRSSDKNTNIVILSKIGRALIAYNQERYEKAIEYFASLIKEYNYVNENILESLGICYYKANKVKKAKEIFEATIAQYPNNYKVKTYLALINLSFVSDEDNNNSFNKSFEELMTAYKMNNFSDDTIPALLINLCNIFLISGKYEEAGILCQKLNNQLEYGEIKFNSENLTQNNKVIRVYNDIKSAILVINAKYLLSIGKKNEAFIKFINSVQENPKNIEAQFGLGRIYLLTNNFSEAENCFEECKKILDENKWVSFKILKYYGYVISLTKFKPKEVEKAIDLLKQAIEIKKDDIDCYIKLGELLNLREPDKSLKYYMKAVELIKLKRKVDKKELKNDNEHKNKNLDEPSIYSDDILPELLNNIGCTLLLKEEYQDVEKYLNEAKNILKEELKKIENKYKTENNLIKEEDIDKVDKKKILRFKALKISVDFNLALYYDSQAQFDHSHFLYKKIIAENPYFVEAYIKLSELYKIRGNKIKSESYIKLAIDKHYKLVQDERKTQKKEDDKDKDKEKTDDKNNELNKQNNDKMEIEEEKEKKEIKKEEKENEGDKQPKKDEKAEQKAVHRLITIMGKPVNPMIIRALYLYENRKEYDAIAFLNKILMEYKPYDPYTLTCLANIYYSMSIDVRTKMMDKEKMKKAIELYFRALEYDKYNALAAIGLSNCLCEFNYVDKAIDVYRSVMEKFPNDHNAYVNASFIYMDDKKYEKAYILLHKVLMSIFHGNNAKIENLLIKCCIDMKEFKSANQHIKNLIMKYPDNLIYQFNYGFLLYSQFDDIINKSTRKYTDTEKAIKLLSRALNIFEELNKTKKDDRYDKIIQKNEFYYKCEEMYNICKVNLKKANEILLRDKENEENMKKKTEEDFNEYKKKIEEQKELKEKEEKEKEKVKEIPDERIDEENKEILEIINKRNMELQMEKMKEKGRKGKKRGKKKERRDSEEDEYDDNPDLNLEEKEYEESVRNEEENENKDDNPVNSDYYDDEQEEKKEKSKKRHLLKKRKRSEDEDINLYDKENENKENDNGENNNENNQEDINTNEPEQNNENMENNNGENENNEGDGEKNEGIEEHNEEEQEKKEENPKKKNIIEDE